MLKKMETTRDIPIIFLTASTRPDIVEAIRALDGCHYLSKPINTDSLDEVLRSLTWARAHARRR